MRFLHDIAKKKIKEIISDRQQTSHYLIFVSLHRFDCLQIKHHTIIKISLLDAMQNSMFGLFIIEDNV